MSSELSGQSYPARDAIAAVARDWIHETPMSLCDAGADTCPDWPAAYALADLIADDLSERGYLTMGGARRAR